MQLLAVSSLKPVTLDFFPSDDSLPVPASEVRQIGTQWGRPVFSLYENSRITVFGKEDFIDGIQRLKAQWIC